MQGKVCCLLYGWAWAWALYLCYCGTVLSCLGCNAWAVRPLAALASAKRRRCRPHEHSRLCFQLHILRFSADPPERAGGWPLAVSGMKRIDIYPTKRRIQ